MSFSRTPSTGIRATSGHSGGVRAALRPLGPAALGLASALAAGGAVAQDKTEDTEGKFVLPTVQVQAESEKQGYNTGESTLTRVPKPLVDTPQNVVVVPEQVMQEQAVTSVREALRNVSGITISAGEGGRQGDTFNLRGFSAQTDMFRDGVRDLGWFTRDTFNLEGVEVFFGPSSVLFGRGSTGGIINLATKKPRKASFQDVRLTGGTAPSGRLEADVNEALTDNLQVRVSAMGQLAAIAGRDVVRENRAGVAPSARLELGKHTSLDVDYFYQHEDSIPDYGHPYFNGYPVSTSLDVPRSAFYGVKGSDQELVNAHIATGRFLHRFGDDGPRFTNTLRFGQVNRMARPTAPRGLTPADNPTTVGRQRFETTTDNAYLVDQADLRDEFQTGFLKHTANAGLEASWETRDQSRNNLNAVGLPTGANLPADLFNPDPSPDLSSVSRVFSTANTSRQWTVAGYVSDQIEITRFLEVLGSVRVDTFGTNYTTEDATHTQTKLQSRDTFANWRAGLVVHPMEDTSLYALYGTSANPSAEAGTLSNDTASLEPEKNRILEVGGKADLLSERLGLSAAVFRVDKTNARVPNTDPEGPPQILEGAQRVQGFNLAVAGTILDGWKAFANYTHLDSKILEHTNAYLVGQPLPNTPKRSFSLWTTVELTRAFTLGGGAVYQDVTTVNNPTSSAQSFNKVPNFWRFDAFASYSWRWLSVQLNVNNLSNALYYKQYYAGHAVPADARSATLSARLHF